MRRWLRNRTAERIAAGLCTKCGKRPPLEGVQHCAPCKAERKCIDAQSYARRKTRAAETGRCIGCMKRRAVKGLCPRCRAKTRPYQLARQRRLFEAGLCGKCGEPNPRHPHRTLCAECSAYVSAENRRRATERRASPPKAVAVTPPKGCCRVCGIRLRDGNASGRCSAHRLAPHLSVSTPFDEAEPDDYIPGLDDDDGQLAYLRMSP